MTIESTLPGIHPTDDLLLFFGDIRSDADAAELVEELRIESADLGADGGGVDDPFAPAAVASAWDHLRSCARCRTRSGSLHDVAVAAIVAPPSDVRHASVGASNYPATTTAGAATIVDDRVEAALAVFVPNAAATPESLVRATPPKRRWFARRASGAGSSGIGSSSSSSSNAGSSGGGVLTRPWVVGVAAVALLASIGAAFALRPRSTEQSAVATVAQASASERAQSGDASFAADDPTDGIESDVAATTKATAETEAAADGAPDGAMAAEAAEIPVETEASRTAPSATNDAVVQAEPVVPEPSRAQDQAPPPPQASRKRVTNAAPPPPQTPAPLPKARLDPNPQAAGAAATAAGGVAELSVGRSTDLGAFADSDGALDRFGAQFPVSPSIAVATPSVGQEPTTTRFADAARPAAPTEVVCPAVRAELRVLARVGDRNVLLLRVTEPNGTVDAVIDATTCAELARRATTVGSAAPPTTPPTTSAAPTIAP